ncbi:MAG: NAD(P)/FAD-dependent oxidoreductase [Woeseia sp.]
MQSCDVLILGGGAAGLMCAITAGRRGRRVLLLEGSNRVGKKILMSGGGRCNFTNLYCEPANYLSANPSFCISALSRYTQWDFIALTQKHGIAYHEKTAGQLFCDESSKQIVAMLLAECADAGVEIRTDQHISEVSWQGRYQVTCEDQSYYSDSLVIATGGLSIPKMGASDLGYRLARQFGLNVLPTRAGLVPFTFTGALHEMADRLSGVSSRAALASSSQAFTENILFTHRGLSGPAALQISSYWSPGESLRINYLPTVDVRELLVHTKREQPRNLLRTVLAELLPRKLVLELQTLIWPQYAETAVANIPDRELQAIATKLTDGRLLPAATEGYRTAEVTLGGVDTAGLSSKTMEALQQPGLYIIGEVVDVTGHLGGFNFQWAWASGHAAGAVA